MHIAMHILQQLVNLPRSIHAVLSVEVWAKMNNKKTYNCILCFCTLEIQLYMLAEEIQKQSK